MPAWLITLLISLVTKWVIPAIIAWLKERFPWIPGDKVAPILQEMQNNIKSGMHRRQARKIARDKLKKCYGVACPSDTKGLG